jgi:thiamine biosynthesis lipoprotein
VILTLILNFIYHRHRGAARAASRSEGMVLATVSIPALFFAAAVAGEVRETRLRMATQVSITVVGLSSAAARVAIDRAFGSFDVVEREMNEWRAESALSRLNRAAGTGGAALPLPPELCAVLRQALRGAEETGGLFDPTWAALRDLWKFGSAQDGLPPAADAVRARCELVDWRQVELRATEGTCVARLPRPGMQIGLGGIAKGWGVDAAVARLRAAGARHFLVQAGGDLYAAGTRNGRAWKIAVRDPRGPPEKAFAEVEVRDAAFSTSGDYEHFFIHDGVRYHHLIDPRTCAPARASRSATVLAPSATAAEILTKAAFIAGGNDGLQLVEAHRGEALIVTSDNRVVVSERLRRHARIRSPTP